MSGFGVNDDSNIAGKPGADLEKREMLYEGKAKKIYLTNQPDLLWVSYKDDATAFNGEKQGMIERKGMLNNRISTIFFELLHREGIDNHFVRRVSDTEQLVRKVRIVPVEVVVRNVTAGSMAKRLGLEEGIPLDEPIVEWYYKDDALGDPLINDDHVRILKAATKEQLQEMKTTALSVNDVLSAFMSAKGVLLVDFKLEFGVTEDGRLLLADEISPDTCRFWDKETNEKMDKDRFRHDLGQVEDAYQTILQRLGGDHHV